MHPLLGRDKLFLNMMVSPGAGIMDHSDMPTRCRECGRFKGPVVNTTCEYCGRLEFYEEILCDLNRRVQDTDNFKCSAYQPLLRVVNGTGVKATDSGRQGAADFRQQFFRNLLDTDKYKYLKALALQRLAENPDEEIIHLRYHLVWNAAYRKPLFYLNRDCVDYLHRIFQENTVFIGGFVYLLWVARDHVHIFIESDGKASLDTVIRKIKRFSSDAVLKKYPDLKQGGTPPYGIWDEGYFVETVG